LKYFVKSFGCRLNQYYADYFCNAVLYSGHELTGSLADAEVVAIASCVVTHRAERDLRRYVSHSKRTNPSARVVVFGCYPKIKEPKGVIASGEIGDVLKELNLKDPIVLKQPIYRIRANVRIQEGCNFRCSYCIVPMVRGLSRSRPLEEIMGEIENLVSSGTVEIVLTGIQTGQWGREWGLMLSDLIIRIHNRFPHLRIRLSSISPIHITKEIIDLLKQRIILPHLHLPLQHGSSRILKLMKRPYKLQYYIDLVEKLHLAVPDIAIGSDIIVGYPEETDIDFEESLKVIESLPFAYLHIFEFSARPYTYAGTLKPLPQDVVKQRKWRLLEVARDRKGRFLENYIGRNVDAVIESLEGCFFHATTDNYIKLLVAAKYDLTPGRVYRFEILKREDYCLKARPLI